MNKIGSLGILILLVVGLGLNLANVISLIGTRGFLALLLFIFGSLLIGFAVGGRDPGVRTVMGLGTAQRNVSAAILITLTNFAGTNAVPYVLVAAILLPLILISVARWLGGAARQRPNATQPHACPETNETKEPDSMECDTLKTRVETRKPNPQPNPCFAICRS